MAIELHNLLTLLERQDEIPWQPFQDGVEIYRIYGDGISGPNASLLRFAKNGRVPLHEHTGYEHIFILSGSQKDEESTLNAGSLGVHPPGTSHSVVSETGCIALAIYEKPVRFLKGRAAD